MLYSLIRPILFAVDPEEAHALALDALHLSHRLGLSALGAARKDVPLSLMGLRFPNRLGLAAGFDKNARYIDPLGSLGFGFIEVGTVTPLPQPGQSKPRLFRLPRSQALINRMGFPNEGAEAVIRRTSQRTFQGVCGVNIGKNALTPLDRAIDDYVACFRSLASCFDYVAVNVSSPNTEGLRTLQQTAELRSLLDALMVERRTLAT